MVQWNFFLSLLCSVVSIVGAVVPTGSTGPPRFPERPWRVLDYGGAMLTHWIGQRTGRVSAKAPGHLC